MEQQIIGDWQVDGWEGGKRIGDQWRRFCSDRVDEFLDQLNGEEVADKWLLSRYNYWQKQGNKAKGITGEKFIEYMLTFKYENDHTGGASMAYDLCFNGNKIEVKTSFANKQKGIIKHDNFKWQHIGMHKDWDYIVLIGINPEEELGHVRRGWRDNPQEVNIVWLSRKQVEDFIKQGLITPQQGGQDGGNDDWWTIPSFFKDINYGYDFYEVPF